MTERPQTPLKLRKFAKPKQLQRKNHQVNDLEMQLTPIQMNQSDRNSVPNPQTPSNPLKVPKTRNHQSIAENFRKQYTDLNIAPSYSGDLHAIANEIPSYRYVKYHKCIK